MTHVDAMLDTVVVAYDIDGALTTSEGREQFLNDASTKKVITGIVTARDKESLEDFLESNEEISSNAEFTRSNKFKGRSLNDIEYQYPDADRYVYVGSWFRDWIASTVAGWEYKSL